MGRRVCGIDLETTGLSFTDDHITEIAWAVKDIGDPKPLVMQSHFVLPPEDLFISPTIEQLTKIQMKHLKTGRPLGAILARLMKDIGEHRVDFVVAHNGENFDKPFLQTKNSQLKDQSYDSIFLLPWLDTSVDCIYPPDCRHNNLMYVAAYFGFINPFPHAALFDVMTMLRVLEEFDFHQVVARAASPWCVVEAKVSYDGRDAAKARRYWWETIGNTKYPKSWVKRIKESELEQEQKDAPFEVVRIA